MAAHGRVVVETAAATDEQVLRVDRLQYELGTGPLISGVWDDDVVSCADLTVDTRWPEWSTKAAAETGVRSLLIFRMFAARQRMGALTLVASQPHAFSLADIEAGISFAAHTAVAIEVAREDENKDVALDSRSIIGQATGILMERFGLDAVRAFAVLKRLSSQTNVKLHQVAVDLIRTRELPG